MQGASTVQWVHRSARDFVEQHILQRKTAPVNNSSDAIILSDFLRCVAYLFAISPKAGPWLVKDGMFISALDLRQALQYVAPLGEEIYEKTSFAFLDSLFKQLKKVHNVLRWTPYPDKLQDPCAFFMALCVGDGGRFGARFASTLLSKIAGHVLSPRSEPLASVLVLLGKCLYKFQYYLDNPRHPDFADDMELVIKCLQILPPARTREVGSAKSRSKTNGRKTYSVGSLSLSASSKLLFQVFIDTPDKVEKVIAHANPLLLLGLHLPLEDVRYEYVQSPSKIRHIRWQLVTLLSSRAHWESIYLNTKAHDDSALNVPKSRAGGRTWLWANTGVLLHSLRDRMAAVNSTGTSSITKGAWPVARFYLAFFNSLKLNNHFSSGVGTDGAVASYHLTDSTTTALLANAKYIYCGDGPPTTPSRRTSHLGGSREQFELCKLLIVKDLLANTVDQLDAWQQLYALACVRTGFQDIWHMECDCDPWESLRWRANGLRQIHTLCKQPDADLPDA